MIKFNQVTKRYPGGFEALNQVDFSLSEGELAFITGHSGAGKTTFLKLIAKLVSPTSGQVIVNDVELNRLKKNKIAAYRSNIGIILQAPNLLNDRTVFDNVSLPLTLSGTPAALITKRVHAALDLVGLLSKDKMLPIHLSCGEQQRVSIARAIVHKPALLLADEPTGNLDPALSLETMKLFNSLNQAGVSVVIATHDLALIAGMKHRIVQLRKGKIC